MEPEIMVEDNIGRVTRVGTLGDPPEEVVLRPITAADEPFLRDVYASTRAKELESVPWTDQERRAFCDSQFDLQDTHYRREFPSASFDVVAWGSRPAGRLLVAFGTTECEILDIAITPEARGRGLGTLLLRWVQTNAAAADVSLALAVEPGNPARRLYDRLGFQVRIGGALHVEMVWRSCAVGSEGADRFCDLARADAGLETLRTRRVVPTSDRR
jgi:ribosomal protein S18 acetylase RimI-like enzyme